MGGSFSTMSTFDILIVGSTVAISVSIIGFLIKNGNFSKKNNPNYGCTPFPRTSQVLPFNWFNGWANWKSGIYHGKNFKSEIAYLGHQAIKIGEGQAIVRSNGFLYAMKAFFSIFIGLFAVLFTFISVYEYSKFKSNGSRCVTITQEAEGQVFTPNYLEPNVKNYIYREYCIIRNILLYDKRFDTFEKKTSMIFRDRFIFFCLNLLSVSLFIWLIIYKPSPPPLVFDRKKRLIYTQYKGKLYISDWDRAFYTVRYTYQAYSIGFELFHLNKKGAWETRWFTIAGHHYFGELCEFLMVHKAINSDRSHAMRAWLILYMEKGELAVHPVLPFKGILDYMTPRQEQLDVDIDQQVEDLLAKVGEAPGEAEKVRTPSKEIQQLLKRNNDLDLYDILSEKNLAKYIALRDAKAAERNAQT